MFLSSASSCVYFDTITACWRKQCACVHLCKSACVRARERVRERERKNCAWAFASASDLLMYLLIQKLAKEGKKRKQERWKKLFVGAEILPMREIRKTGSDDSAGLLVISKSPVRFLPFEFLLCSIFKMKKEPSGTKSISKISIAACMWTKMRLIATCLTGSLGCFFGCEVMGSNPSTQTIDLLRGSFPD